MMDMWTGVVEDRQDPLMMGRCRVRVFGIHTKNNQEIPTNDLPWATPIMPLTSASISGVGESPVGPVEGTHVVGFWRDGENKQQPIMIGTLPGIPEDAPDTSNPANAGLQSPLENYPKDTDRHGLNESDTSRLARYRYPIEGEDGLVSGEGVCEECVKDTVVQKKLDERVLNVAVANDHGHYSEPPTKFNSKYPFNHVKVSESAKIIADEMNLQPEFQFTGGRNGWVGDNPFVFLDISKAKSFGWSPKYNIERSVRETVSFLLNNQWIFDE